MLHVDRYCGFGRVNHLAERESWGTLMTLRSAPQGGH